jgi:hypothetical protein
MLRKSDPNKESLKILKTGKIDRDLSGILPFLSTQLFEQYGRPGMFWYSLCCVQPVLCGATAQPTTKLFRVLLIFPVFLRAAIFFS